jgi:hypothetical protein
MAFPKVLASFPAMSINWALSLMLPILLATSLIAGATISIIAGVIPVLLREEPVKPIYSFFQRSFCA